MPGTDYRRSVAGAERRNDGRVLNFLMPLEHLIHGVTGSVGIGVFHFFLFSLVRNGT